ncbi:hypothetical protein BDA96_06G121600 [Sorghum bicolor]|uniref:Uncharacterized protein n=1 Tax=Sorghum bicolor TaxID=4558 RepID=A0A921QS66_SORBI|nr:hypothetical protein BDA96_06G121600 [Sorghum bicolor]
MTKKHGNMQPLAHARPNARTHVCILTGGNRGASRSDGQHCRSECVRVRGATRVPGTMQERGSRPKRRRLLKKKKFANTLEIFERRE